MKKCSTCKSKCKVFDNSKATIKAQLLNYESSIFNLIIYFEYLSPNTSSSLSSSIDLTTSKTILEKMLNVGFHSGDAYLFTTEKIESKILNRYSLEGESINSSCKRFVCNVCSKDDKNNLTALLRHIRNSIAHARYSIIKEGNYFKFLFEDKTKNGNVTFRMVINHSTLKKWKKILTSYET